VNTEIFEEELPFENWLCNFIRRLDWVIS